MPERRCWPPPPLGRPELLSRFSGDLVAHRDIDALAARLRHHYACARRASGTI